MQKLYNRLAREDGQTMAEYGVVLAVITIAVFGALALLSGNIVNAITRVAGYITYDKLDARFVARLFGAAPLRFRDHFCGGW